VTTSLDGVRTTWPRQRNATANSLAPWQLLESLIANEPALGWGPLAFFRKASGSISGPHDDIVKPDHVRLLDYEVEIGLVLGQEMPVGITITEANLATTSAGWWSPTTSRRATCS
jgi:hypothetical protein